MVSINKLKSEIMGYEVKVLIGTVSRFDNQTPTWFSTVATYDLCKVDLFEMTEGINCSGAKLSMVRYKRR